MPPRKYDDCDRDHVFALGKNLISRSVWKYEVCLITAGTFAFQPMRFRPRIQLLVMAFDLYCRKLFPLHQGLWITTECGKLQVSPGESAILPQGFRFAVDLPDGPSRGYVAEIFGTHFQLPDLGPIVYHTVGTILIDVGAIVLMVLLCSMGFSCFISLV
ncbi:uncharacterized protein LOC119989204 isoform X6 [Tripterygium wilfordii]|uniref:uncharacterized protein LOC119989204 isoform X6 n=1 Tax=Tripterygium wilfordii TaxID=458696 RepID=UPI0018F7ED92|nr:uncharacterized protein LOC119989204 isoform X6 [Tripterygium wilfordii]XP_038690522.1 uncharacterized protein LOC119989204 isoform X6 [Tripterygium wilfordii]